MIDLIRNPCCRSEDLGRPIPDSIHAVSVCLPLWRHNIGYEEADPNITDKMQSGYPRFCLHPLVVELFERCEARFAGEGQSSFAFPSRNVAQRCVDYIRAQTRQLATIHDLERQGVHAVCLPSVAKPVAMQFWQHTGEIVSSRLAAAVLNERTAAKSQDDAKQVIRDRIAGLIASEPEDVFLFPTGMAAIFFAYRVFQKLFPNRKSVQFGFPYVDLLKIQQRFGASAGQDDNVWLFPNGDTSELDTLERRLADERVMGLFCELPGNPLLKSPDLSRLSEMSSKYDFPLLVDDTLGAFLNVDAMPSADALATSLTKFFSGAGNVAGGALVLNPDQARYPQLKAAVHAEFEDLLFAEDATILESNSRDVCERIRRINQTSEQVCDTLRQHPLVERLYYPKYESVDNYRSCMKPDGGYGGLFSLQIHNADVNAPRLFDALRISKGPNLGTNFSLCCPYTILAHYNELEFAQQCGVSRYLLRVSVGLEEPDWIIGRFTEALNQLK